MPNHIFDFIRSSWKQLLIICLIAAISSTVVAFILPPQYKATTILFSSQDNNISKSLLNDEPYSKDYLAFGEEKNSEQMLQILKSDEVMQAINKKYNLIDLYGLSKRSDKYAVLKDYYSNNFNSEITEYQSIKVQVYDHNPDRAALMANSMVSAADSLFRAIVHQRTEAAYRIVKQQYDSMLQVENSLEDSMNYFRKAGILNFDLQVREYTRGYSEAEVKGSPASIEALESKLKPFQQYGKQYFIIENNLIDAYKWMQQLKVNYLQAKANAEKYIPPFFVAEKAVPPDKRTYPIRWLIVAGSTMAAFFFGLAALLFINKITPPR